MSSGDTRSFIFSLKISILSFPISHAILLSLLIRLSLRERKSLKSPQFTFPTLSSIQFLVSISALVIVGLLSQRVSSRSKVIILILLIIFLLLDVPDHRFLQDVDNLTWYIFV